MGCPGSESVTGLVILCVVTDLHSAVEEVYMFPLGTDVPYEQTKSRFACLEFW